jgi:uncharacterized phiE125 gp8 family phage protein
MKPVLVTPPAELPVSLSEAKAAAIVDYSDDDILLQSYLQAAVDLLDGYSGLSGRCLVTQTWALGFERWENCLDLPFPDVSAATVKYRDENGTEQTVNSAHFELIQTHGGATVRFLDAFNSPNLDTDRLLPVTVEFDAGYGTRNEVPANVKAQVMMVASQLYNNRDGDDPLHMPLLGSFKVASV